LSEAESPPPDAVADLITFQAPPLNEVVLSVQFDDPVVDDAFALAEFWPAVRSDFPRLERHLPIAPAREDFGVPPSPQEGLPFEVLTEHLAQRYWFVSDDGTRLVQMQPDRFILNWRQTNPGDTYPRYRELRSEFRRLYEVFLSLLGPDRSQQAVAALCEVSYINHIEAQSPEHTEYHVNLGRIIRLVRPITDDVAGDPEDAQFHQRYRLADPSGSEQPIGRLYVSVLPAYRKADSTPIYAMTLLARGRPETGSLSGAVGFFDFGRGLLVREFASITTEAMHRKWRMERDDRP
jgi:uncharacterized protein (TIGR04255 family)